MQIVACRLEEICGQLDAAAFDLRRLLKSATTRNEVAAELTQRQQAEAAAAGRAAQHCCPQSVHFDDIQCGARRTSDSGRD